MLTDAHPSQTSSANVPVPPHLHEVAAASLPVGAAATHRGPASASGVASRLGGLEAKPPGGEATSLESRRAWRPAGVAATGRIWVAVSAASAAGSVSSRSSAYFAGAGRRGGRLLLLRLRLGSETCRRGPHHVPAIASASLAACCPAYTHCVHYFGPPALGGA